MREKIDVTPIFEKIKELSNSEKLMLKRAWKMPFTRLPWTTKVLFFDITKDIDIECFGNYELSFLVNMMSVYINQDCKNGVCFEQLLKKLYDSGNMSVKSKIGYMCDEPDHRVRMDSIRHYVTLFSKDDYIDVAKLTSDILNWNYEVKDTWVKTVAGINTGKMEEN